jgi:predicted phosphoribosyltransferase/dienelactone hydrolase
MQSHHPLEDKPVEIPADARLLRGILNVPPYPRGIVLFAHGSGSGRNSPRNRAVARALHDAGLATLLLDLLDEAESEDRSKVFDVDLLANRLHNAACWVRRDAEFSTLGMGYFGASTGAGAALIAAARHPDMVQAIVSRGGRPDLAGDFIRYVKAPTLLIVGGDDEPVIALNQEALDQLNCIAKMIGIPGATHLFSEPGALEEVARLAANWFVTHLAASEPAVTELMPEVETGRFHDRTDAAHRLAGRLRDWTLVDPLVLAIPRGGVVTGAVLAHDLGAELDVILSRKIRAPGRPELAIGAIAEDGQVHLNDYADRLLDVQDGYLKQECRQQHDEILRRQKLFRGARPRAKVAGRSVIVTDDGIATGSTMVAALHALRAEQPHELIVAVPVAAPDRLRELRRLCDDVICLFAPEDFTAVGQFYDDFRQVDDEEVIRLLSEDGKPAACRAER